MVKVLALCGAVLFAAVAYALAQDPAPPPTPSFWLELWAAVQAPIIAAAAAIIPLIGAMIYRSVERWTNAETARIAQEMFQAAATRAAGIALNALGDRALTDVVKADDPAILAGVKYFKETMPDMTRGKAEGLLRNVVLANVGKLVAPAVGGLIAAATERPRK